MGILDDNSPCGCGNYNDVIDVVLKQMNQMLDNDCPIWAINVGLIMSTAAGYVTAGMCQQSSMESTISKENLMEMQLEALPAILARIKDFTDLRDRVHADVDRMREN